MIQMFNVNEITLAVARSKTRYLLRMLSNYKSMGVLTTLRERFQWRLMGILLCLTLSITSCREKVKTHPAVFTDDDVAIEIGRDVEILYSDSAVVKVRVLGPLLHNYTAANDPKQVFVEGIDVTFYDNSGRQTSHLVAKKAVREQGKKMITARDSVVLTTVKKEILETEELVWDEKLERLSTQKFVKVTSPEEVIYGFGLEANQDFTYWKILVPQGRIATKDAQ
jgi:LPS export ABC transporter protein LptC